MNWKDSCIKANSEFWCSVCGFNKDPKPDCYESCFGCEYIGASFAFGKYEYACFHPVHIEKYGPRLFRYGILCFGKIKQKSFRE